MRYTVTLGGEEREVEVVDTGGRLCVRLDGEELEADVSVLDAGAKYSVLLGDRSFFVTVDDDGSRLALGVAGRVYDVEVEDERECALRALGGGAGGGGGVVESVMPGIVRRVDVAPGAEVRAGDRLVVLEAMKMENEIRAEADATVVAVHVNEGQTVEGGDPLVTLAPVAAG